MEQGLNVGEAEEQVFRTMGYAPPGPTPATWRRVKMPPQKYGTILAEAHDLWSDRVLRSIVDRVVGGNPLPTQADLDEIHKIIEESSGIPQRAKAFAERLKSEYFETGLQLRRQ